MSMTEECLRAASCEPTRRCAALDDEVLFHRFELRPCQTCRIRCAGEIVGKSVRSVTSTDKEAEAVQSDGATADAAISVPVPSSHRQSFVVPSDSVDDPADGAALDHLLASQASARSQLSAPAAWRPVYSTGCCRLACSLRANPWSVGRWIVLHAISSLVHWCCSYPGQGRAANPWLLRRPGSSDFQSTSRHSDCPNSRGPAPHLRYRSSTLSPSPSLSPTLF
ncbi:uncharacterized protein M421DRAFT_176189 [Didymella exigua CBS 183.55]|uniref:Uncharacterized protein n=1 Tax=Didymella exigua CBS 183.55 TaxID=1150837 RepID=A0A6A5RLR1_9PLEO|nr:uncharacterized protein M421DRAFT_176189 [Didymella exigua CBS 183.55]KAF1927296.1 hypothetical protein M421DRAFT_176189 [Didymella exigua CBS 183.55]